MSLKVDGGGKEWEIISLFLRVLMAIGRDWKRGRGRFFYFYKKVGRCARYRQLRVCVEKKERKKKKKKSREPLIDFNLLS